MTRGILALIGITVGIGCSGSKEAEEVVSDASASASADAARDGSSVSPACAGAAVPPTTLDCTGLYSNIETKTLSAGVEPYAPANPLWSDGAVKDRWISIPKGMKIDATDPNEWKFPIGTKVWKQFRWQGKRIETRLFQKTLENLWVHATYAWNADESAASISKGGDIPVADGGTYHIPTRDECDDCHKGRTDRILGFEQVSLGLPGATGLTLEKLVAANRITPVPQHTTLEIGDDGTGAAAPALGWLHINCGVTCHNGNSGSTGYGAKMRMRLDPTQLDGRSSVDFDTRTTTLGITANQPAWIGRTRIVPGDPAGSLLVALISNRGKDNPEGNQMPPIATRIVDPTGIKEVVAWIRKMAPPPGDASVSEPIPDASIDVSVPVEDASVHHDAAPARDAGKKTPDAARVDSGSGADAQSDASG